MINLQKSLEKEAKIQRKEISEIGAITDVTKLLEEKSRADLEIIQMMGMYSGPTKIEHLRGRKIELERLESKYGQIFTFDEIKAIACKYALLFLKTEHYKGNVDIRVPQKIREFAEETGTELRNTDYEHKFYILAPPLAFNLQDRPAPDPLLFYKVDSSNYRLVHKWGEDFTHWRAFLGWMNESEYDYGFCWFAICFLPLLFTLSFVGIDWPIALPIAAAVGVLFGCYQAIDFLPWENRWQSIYKR